MYPLNRIKEISSQKQMQFISHGITTVEELATLFPRTYHDFREVTYIKDLQYGQLAVVYGRVVRLIVGSRSNSLIIRDGDNNEMSITWFNSDYMFRQFAVGDEAYFCGRISEFRMSWTMTNPLHVSKDASHILKIHSVYPKYRGMSEKYMKDSIQLAISFLEANRKDMERDLFARQIGMAEYIEALKTIHAPNDNNKYRLAKRRMDFEKIYDFYSELKKKDSYRVASAVAPIKKLDATTDFIKNRLPFALTDGQLDVVRKITLKCMKGERIHSIVSGDVGCGKTVVALIAAVLMAENGYQTVIAAPTLVLARQHFNEMTSLTGTLDINGSKLRLALLTGETSKKDRKNILKQLAAGEIDVLIGTHAVFAPDIEFKSLGMTIIDEEHKFGVEQKAALEEHDKEGVHHISMTATPIPRSIAMTVYTDESDVLPIQTMPKGRKPTITKQCFTPKEAFDEVRREVDAGHQAYIICPFIEQSDDEKFQDVVSVDKAQEMLNEYIKSTPGFSPKTTTISGNMKQSDILANINLFETGQADILISTTIVEVGVNVPNATAICIMSASRFGLSGLHQLRGRVGRGGGQGYCLLCDDKRNEKLDVLCSTTNGFEIAEKDLLLRGPGDLIGEAQTGSNEVIDLIIRRKKLSKLIKDHFFPPKTEGKAS